MRISFAQFLGAVHGTLQVLAEEENLRELGGGLVPHCGNESPVSDQPAKMPSSRGSLAPCPRCCRRLSSSQDDIGIDGIVLS